MVDSLVGPSGLSELGSSEGALILEILLVNP